MKEQTDVTPAPTPNPFNFFAGGIKVIKPTGSTHLQEVIDWVKNGKYATVVTQIRAAQSEKEAKFLKKSLDYVTFSGTFAPVRHADNLAQHSCFIVIDFDHNPNAAHLKIQLEADPYVAACFLSPRGEGVKAVIRIKDPNRHKETFADLVYYFNDVYRLTDKEKVDPSGSDVSRACFLSHDPTAYYNPDSKMYAIKNLIPVTAPRTVQQMAQDATETEKHIAAVVERIEHHRMDICNEYGTEWLLIAFSLSTLGEAGRDYFHRISRLNAKYDEKDTEEKFDNAIKTTRFTNPAKFFSICKDYGVDVSRPKAEKSKEKAPKSQEKENSKPKKNNDPDGPENADHPVYNENTVAYKHGGIMVKGGRSWDWIAANFQIFIKYRTEDESEEVTWILEIKRNDGKCIYVEVIHDDFCSARKLKNIFASKQLGFKVKDNHLDELHSYLFTKTKYASASKVIRYGYHSESGVYFFANAAINLKTNEIVKPDEFGIVQTDDFHLSIPRIKKKKDQRFVLSDQKVAFNEFWNLFASAHGYETAFIPVCFYIFSLFRDMGIKHKSFSPILYLKGPAGTGKSAMIRVLTMAFGPNPDNINLKGKNTEAGIVKSMSQASNAIIWMDEFHNEIPQLEGLLQAAYDNNGYTKSGADFNSIETTTVEIHSALALTSNYIPKNGIFFSRCIFVPVISNKKSEQQREAFDALKALSEAGLGSMTIELLKYRRDLEANENYVISYNRLYNALKLAFKGQDIGERLITNLAQTCAAAYFLQVAGYIQMLRIETTDQDEILDEFVEICQNYIMRQFRVTKESTAVAEFFEIIQGLYESNTINEGVHFKFKGDMIQLNFRKLYNLFAMKYRITFNSQAPDRDTLQTELTTLAGKDSWEDLSKNIRFAVEGFGGEVKSTMPNSGSCELDYKQLAQTFGLELGGKR